jgi:hypothetical protein
MNRFLLCLCLLAALLAVTITATPCVAQPANGVIAQERVVTLPQDGGRWYVSVVGETNDARYRQVLSWFDSGSLLKLRNSTHYNPVTSDSAIFAERYASNTPALPMVRIQNAEGVIYSQLCSDEIPMTAEGLSAQVADDVRSGPKTGCILHPFKRFQERQDANPILGWRQRHNCPTPGPKPEPVNPDPTPGPIDNNDQPAIDETPAMPPAWLLAPICMAAFAVGSGFGVVSTFKARWKAAK